MKSWKKISSIPFIWVFYLTLWLLGITFVPRTLQSFFPVLAKSPLLQAPLVLSWIFFFLLFVQLGVNILRLRRVEKIGKSTIFFNLLLLTIIIYAIAQLNFWIGSSYR